MVYWLLAIITFGLMLVGLAGVIIPALPGLPLMWLAALGFGWYDGFQQITGQFLLFSGLLIAGVTVLEQVASSWGTARVGGSRLGVWGAFIGGLAGMFFLPIGLLAGPFIGAVAGELLAGRRSDQALRVGLGSVLGVLGGTLIKLITAVVFLIWFTMQLFA